MHVTRKKINIHIIDTINTFKGCKIVIFCFFIKKNLFHIAMLIQSFSSYKKNITVSKRNPEKPC